MAIILSVGTNGGAQPGRAGLVGVRVFFINGLITIAMSWRYKSPLGFCVDHPRHGAGGPALQHLSFAEVIGAFYATSALVLVLGPAAGSSG